MWQEVLMGAIVVAACAYALWYWLPKGLRARLGRFDKRLAQDPGCGACSNCNACATPKAGSPAGSSAKPPIWIRPGS